MGFLTSLLNFINNNLMASSAFITMAIEMGLRLTPSAKPLSIAYGISSAAHLIGNIFSSFGSFLDKVLPQKLS